MKQDQRNNILPKDKLIVFINSLGSINIEEKIHNIIDK